MSGCFFETRCRHNTDELSVITVLSHGSCIMTAMICDVRCLSVCLTFTAMSSRVSELSCHHHQHQQHERLHHPHHLTNCWNSHTQKHMHTHGHCRRLILIDVYIIAWLFINTTDIYINTLANEGVDFVRVIMLHSWRGQSLAYHVSIVNISYTRCCSHSGMIRHVE